jgi:SAM-dependent methyltransferase
MTAKNAAHSPYDAIADRYDELFSDPQGLAEEARVLDLIGMGDEPRYTQADTLDIGCGTGLLLDYYGHMPGYLGVDPSQNMIDKAVQKHGHRDQFVCSTFEDFQTERRFDLIVALFGAASYVDPAALERVPGMLKPGGRSFLMFYANSYTPVTYLKTGMRPPKRFSFNRLRWPTGSAEPFGNYWIVRGTGRDEVLSTGDGSGGRPRAHAMVV